MSNKIVSIWRPTINLWHHLSLNFFMIMMCISRPSSAFIVRHSSLCSSVRLHRSTQVNSKYSFATTSSRMIHTAKPSSHCNHKLHALNSKNIHQNEEDYNLTLTIPTPSDMEDIGALLSVNSKKGDVILLDGDLGAGKTCFSRGFIRAKTGCGDERVTSPTYLLSNMYSIAKNNDSGDIEEDIKIYHMDLYRLSGTNEDELQPLNLPQVFSNDISLIEWPSRLHTKPEVRLDVTLSIDSSIVQGEHGDSDGDDDEEDGSESASRVMKLVPHGESWVERLKFLEEEGYLDDLIM